MRKLLVMATTLAMVLAVSAPAFAADAVGGDVDINVVDASQRQAAAAVQVNRGDADAGNLGSAAAIDQSLDISQTQVNAGFGDLDGDGIFEDSIFFDGDLDDDGILDDFEVFWVTW